jgi:protease I
MASGVSGRAIAFLATDGVDERELADSWRALADAGADVHLVSLEGGEIRGTQPDDIAARFPVGRVLSEVRAGQYSALVLPGGHANLDRLRTHPGAVAFVRAFIDADKPVAAIGDAVGVLVAADAVRGRTVTSSPDLAAVVREAGGAWVDEPVVVDQKLVTTRGVDALPRFGARVLEVFAEAIDERRLDFTVEQSFPASDPPPGPAAS